MSVSRLELVELIESEVAKLSPRGRELWERLELHTETAARRARPARRTSLRIHPGAGKAGVLRSSSGKLQRSPIWGMRRLSLCPHSWTAMAYRAGTTSISAHRGRDG